MSNLALPVMMGALALVLTGNMGMVPVLGASEMVAAAAILAFAANLFINLGAVPRAAAAKAPAAAHLT